MGRLGDEDAGDMRVIGGYGCYSWAGDGVKGGGLKHILCIIKYIC